MRPLLLLTLYLCLIILFSQQSWIDSVYPRTRVEKNDTELIRSWINLSNRLRVTDTTASLQCKAKVDSIAAASGKAYFTALSYFTEGLYQLSRDQVKASANFEKAIR